MLVVLIYGLGEEMGGKICDPSGTYLAAHEDDLMFPGELKGSLYMRHEEVIVMWLWYIETSIITHLLFLHWVFLCIAG